MTRIKITIEPVLDQLDIQAAMEQVLDFFNACTSSSDKKTYAWKLIHASMNSPFSIEAEAQSFDRKIDGRLIAGSRVQEVISYLDRLTRGERSDYPIDKPRKTSIRKTLARNTTKIRRTIISFAGCPEIVITRFNSEKALILMDEHEEKDDLFPKDMAGTEMGAVDCVILGVITHNRHPALKIRDRATGEEVICRIPKDKQSLFTNMNFSDVWENQRVLIQGELTFGKDGKLSQIELDEISKLKIRYVDVSEIEDTDFTGEYTTEEYIQKFREGGLG